MAKMRILVDGYNLSLEKGTGIATYARNLTYNLKHLGHEVDVLYGYKLPGLKFSSAREMAFFDPESQVVQKWQGRLSQLRFLATAWRNRVAATIPHTGLVIDTGFKSRLPRFDRLLNVDNIFSGATIAHRYFGVSSTVVVKRQLPDIAHWTYPLPVRIKDTKNIYTIHDLIPMRLPYTTLDDNRRFVQMVEWIAATADHIVTVSETSKRDIINLLGVPETKVTNTYQSVELPEAYRDKPADIVANEIKGIFGLDYKEYFLFFGAIEPKKNLGRLIEGYLAAEIETPLVVIGEEAWMAKKELSLLEGDHVDHLSSLVRFGDITQMKRKIRRFKYAPFPVLISLIKGAKAVVVPSLYEGFGLPALESMLCGTPVITTKEGASPEIVGDGAILVDPYNPSEIREAVLALHQNPELAGDMVFRGKRRAAFFSSERYRQNLTELYLRL